MMFTFYPIQNNKENKIAYTQTPFLFVFYFSVFFLELKVFNCRADMLVCHLFIWLPHKCLETFNGVGENVLWQKEKWWKQSKSHKTWSRIINMWVYSAKISSVYFNNSQYKFTFGGIKFTRKSMVMDEACVQHVTLTSFPVIFKCTFEILSSWLFSCCHGLAGSIIYACVVYLMRLIFFSCMRACM